MTRQPVHVKVQECRQSREDKIQHKEGREFDAITHNNQQSDCTQESESPVKVLNVAVVDQNNTKSRGRQQNAQPKARVVLLDHRQNQHSSSELVLQSASRPDADAGTATRNAEPVPSVGTASLTM